MSLIKKVLEYKDEGLSEQEAYQAVNEDIELSKPLHERIKSIFKNPTYFLDINKIKIRLNNFIFNKSNISKKQIIDEILKYSNLYYYVNGLVISVEEDTFYKINKYFSYIKNILNPHFKKEDIQYIVIFLFFYKRFKDIKKYEHIIVTYNQHEVDKKLFIDSLHDLFKHENFQIDLIDDFSNYLYKIDDKIFYEILYILDQLNTIKYSDKEFAKIYEYLIDKDIEYSFTNKSMQKLMSNFLKIENTSIILNPFGGLGGLAVETLNKSPSTKLIYNEINNRTIKLGYMVLMMYGYKDVIVNNIDSLSSFNDSRKYDNIITELPLARKFSQNEIKSLTMQNIKLNNKVIELKTRESILYYVVFILSKLNVNGKAIFNVPISFLFNTNKANKDIREYLIENDYIEAIINLPSGTLYHSGINTALMIINKKKKLRNKIKFINAKLLYVKKTKQRVISESIIDIEDILKSYNKETKESVFIDKDSISKKNYSLDYNRFNKEILELKISLKEGKSKYLIDLAEIKKGRNFDKNSINKKGIIPIIKIQDLHRDVIDMYLKNDNTYSFINSENTIEHECILIATVGVQIKPTIFKPCLELPKIFITSNICAITPKDNITLEYLYYQMYSKIIIDQIKTFTVGTIRMFLTKESLNKLIIPYIDLEKQESFILVQKSSIIAQERSQLESKLKLLDYKEEIEEKESDIVRVLVHQLRATLSTINMEVDILKHIIESNNIKDFKDNNLVISDDDDFQKPKNYTLEEISEKIYNDSKKLHDNLTIVNKVMSFKLEVKDFETEDIYSFFKTYIDAKRIEIGNKYKIKLKGKKVNVEFNKKSFTELLDQLLLNAEKHAFSSENYNEVSFNIKENLKKQIVIIEYQNNGKKFKVSRNNYLEAFKKGQRSNGSGIGGNYIHRIIKAHYGDIFLLDSNSGFKLKIEIPFNYNRKNNE